MCALLLLFTQSLKAAYVFQTVAGEAFDTVTNNVVWTNDPGQTDYPTDDDYQLINLGFTFYLGETGYTQVRLLGNGALHFGTDQGFHKDYNNEALPITTALAGPGFEEPADRVIAGYWDDLEPSLGGTVRYGTLGSAPNRRFVASWENVPRYNGAGTEYSFQILIYENGNVRFRYGNDDENGSSSTIGIEVDDTDFTQFSFNTTNSVNDANDILWTREFPTLNSAAAVCTDTDTVTLNFASAVSPARASYASNFSINNGISVLAATYINSTTVELTTTPMSTGVTYTVSTTFPNQSTTFTLAAGAAVFVNSTTPGTGSYTATSSGDFTITIVGGGGGSGSATRGGQGATVTGTFSVSSGDIIRYVVGAGSLAANGAGGGGSTGVFINNTLVMVAGGGGGGDNSNNAVGQGANNNTSGDNGTGGNAGAGGTAGAGGGASTSAGGGGGINSAGANSSNGQGGQAADLDPSDGVTFVAGGAAGNNSSAGGGGFTGGGGAAPNYWPGGGGGYSGGGAGGSGGRSGGGGSYLNTAAPGYVNGSITAGADGTTGGAGVDGANGSINVSGTIACGPSNFVISHDGNGINCLREAITLTAVDSGGSAVTDYTGTVNLSLSTNHGNWYTTDESGTSSDLAQGTLTDTAGDNDGAATYQFVATDLGNVTLYLENTVRETADIDATEGSVTDDDSEGNITFRPFGFVVTPSPITTQIAGRPFSLTLTAAGQTPSQPNCGVIEEYTGTQAINFWSSYNLPTTSPTQVIIDSANIATSETASAPQNVTFAAGVATVNVQYNDAGQIGISAKDEAGIGEPTPGNVDEIIGGITPFIVRPFGYDVQVDTNPYADDVNDSVFLTAANNFNMTIRSVLWQPTDDLDNNGIPDPFVDSNADGIPDSGGNLSDNGVTPNISQITGNITLTPTALVVTNANGSLATTLVNYNNFPAPATAGAGTYSFSQSWTEVGILQIDALTNSFMSSGTNITGERINIGRFVPDHFNLSITNNWTEQCSGTFSYAGFANGVVGLNKIGQSDSLVFTVQAVNSANNPTLNYDSGFAKLEAGTITTTAFDTVAAANASGTLNTTTSAINFNTSGNASITLSDTFYQFDVLGAPLNLRLDINATDSDSISGNASSNTIENRLGRMRLIDAYGPETSDLEIKIATDYYDGSAWVINSADNCTSYIQSDGVLNPTSYTDNLNAGETAAFSPSTLQTLTAGVSGLANGLWYSAPGNNNYGSVTVDFNLTSQNWLTLDWDGDNAIDNPSAVLNFGYYRGSDRVIFWRELRN
ncbi:DUF6701 domain-containing protein [Aliikangiella sp. IMCC44359]|uniref:DUF6701 domain-containing protein n=1 Tax=Aliikangiella sp. IMCC44359 TaxID=3459125 RepID=UPI00403B16B6